LKSEYHIHVAQPILIYK